MHIVVALGGNALLRRREAASAANQRRNVRRAAEALAPLARDHQLIITHGNGPQVGLLALQSAAGGGLPLDILDAETEGMIGYLIEQEMNGRLSAGQQCATLLTQIEVDPVDPAFDKPSKPIGPIYDAEQARRLARERGWTLGRDGGDFRRVVASPRPRRILELGVIKLLVDQGVIVICAGGGGIPVVRRGDGSLIGVEAVIDKDAASALLASELGAGALLMLTDVDAVYLDWGKPNARPMRDVCVAEIREQMFAPGSMAPKVAAACEFLERGAGLVGIGALADARAILAGRAGTRIRP